MAAPALGSRPGLLLALRPSVTNWQRLCVPGGRCLLSPPSGARSVSQGSLKAMSRRANKKRKSPAPSVESKMQSSHGLTESSAINMMLPGIFVRPPLARLPRDPKPFFNFMYVWSKQKITDVMGLFMFKFATGWKFWKDNTFKRNKAQIVPAAKALHASMCEALARGDKTALRRVCTSQLLGQLTIAIERRPPGRRYGWELVRYNTTALYPRVMDDKIAMFPDGMGTVRQTVVAIASRQRRVEYDDSPKGGGRVVPGSERLADLVEYVVLSACVDSETNKQKDWVIFGTIKPTTLDSFESEKALMKAAEDAELSKYKT